MEKNAQAVGPITYEIETDVKAKSRMLALSAKAKELALLAEARKQAGVEGSGVAGGARANVGSNVNASTRV